jgi:hypothetical protein
MLNKTWIASALILFWRQLPCLRVSSGILLTVAGSVQISSSVLPASLNAVVPSQNEALDESAVHGTQCVFVEAGQLA